MTIVEHRSLLVEDRHTEAPTILDTSELRWFVPGPMPSDIGERFAGANGVLEERCDTYQLRGRNDIGVKRRFRTTIELKVRQAAPVPMRLGSGPLGLLEEWRKWSPAERLVAAADGEWIDVEKSILKRRFSMDGTETVLSQRAPIAGCDIEVAEVAVGVVRAWTVALAAFGPYCTRRDSLLASWRTLTAALSAHDCPYLGVAASMGYPQWLASVALPEELDRSARRPLALLR